MNWGKLNSELSLILAKDSSWLLNVYGRYHVMVTTEDDKTYYGEFTSRGLADLSAQSWIKEIRLPKEKDI